MKNLIRKRIRLKEFDYSLAGYYFITICTKDNKQLLGNIEGKSSVVERPIVELYEYGNIVDSSINSISNYYPNVEIDKYVIMPNHLHMIVIIKSERRLLTSPTNLSTVIQQFKRYVSKKIGFSLWQKSYNDRIIRSSKEYNNIWKYIDENPWKWNIDEYYM